MTRSPITIILAASLLASSLAVLPAFAQEPVGCDKFKWPLDKERAMLSSGGAKVASGAQIASPLAGAVTISLVPFAQAGLPKPPERPPKNPASYAGFLRMSAPPEGATYTISLSSGAWIDVLQPDGTTVKSTAFSGAVGCEGVRKSVRFPLEAKPFVVELSSVRSPTIGLVVTPAAK